MVYMVEMRLSLKMTVKKEWMIARREEMLKNGFNRFFKAIIYYDRIKIILNNEKCLVKSDQT